jgi:nucleotide-binding universal stress UspA family protein
VSGSYSTVMVGTDGSVTSFRAVDRAAALARDADATLVLLTAFRPMSQREEQDARQQLGDDAYKVAGSSPAEGVLQEASDRARAIGATKIETAAVEGDAVDALVDEAIRRKVDLLVVGNRGLNSLAGRLLGSVPANITHKASCDVLVVHTTGKGVGDA